MTLKPKDSVGFRHTNRMLENGPVKRIHKWKTFTGRPPGRPKCQ